MHPEPDEGKKEGGGEAVEEIQETRGGSLPAPHTQLPTVVITVNQEEPFPTRLPPR